MYGTAFRHLNIDKGDLKNRKQKIFSESNLLSIYFQFKETKFQSYSMKEGLEYLSTAPTSQWNAKSILRLRTSGLSHC